MKNNIFSYLFYLTLMPLIISCEWRAEDKPGYWEVTFPQDGGTCNEVTKIGVVASDPDGICTVQIWTGKILSKYRKNLLSGKRCDNPCVSCNADGTLLGINHSEKWKKIYKI